MKRILSLFVAALVSQATALHLKAQTGAGGVIIYRAGAGAYVNASEFNNLVPVGARVLRVVRPDGQSLNVSPEAIVYQIPYPEIGSSMSLPEVNVQLEIARNALRQYPQHKRLIQPVVQRWENAASFAQQQAASESPPQNPPSPSAASTSPMPGSEFDPFASQVTSVETTSPSADSWESLLLLLQGNDFPAIVQRSQSLVESTDSSLAEISQTVQKIATAVERLDAAKNIEVEVRPQADLLRRNANVADRPNPLRPSDNSNQRRAQADRQRAKDMEDNAQRDVQKAEREMEGILNASQKLALSFKETGAYDACIALNVLCEFVARHYGLGFRSGSEFSTLQAKVQDARAELAKAESSISSTKLIAGRTHLESALKHFPQFRAAIARMRELDDLIETLERDFESAVAARDAKDYETALARATSLTGKASDLEGVLQFKTEIETLLANKAKQLALAAVHEAGNKFTEALEIFEIYDQAEDIRRVSEKLGDAYARDFNFLEAISFFERAGLGAKVTEIKAKAEEQKARYKEAERHVRNQRLEEALAIYSDYNDKKAITDAHVSVGLAKEANAEFETALKLYEAAEASEHVERVESLISMRNTLVVEAGRKQAAGDLPEAIRLYDIAGAIPERNQLASAHAETLEKAGQLADAVEYYEMVERFADAKRLRESGAFTVASNSSGKELEPDVIYERNIGGVVTVLVESFVTSGHGTGFFVKRPGWIVTNHHVVDGAQRVKVRTSSGQEFPAEVKYSSKVPDFAVLKIELPFHQCVQLGSSAKVRPGQKVYAIGTPNDEALSGSITAGIVSQINLTFDDNPVIQIDAAINKGNSGGPLFSSTGEVVGINTFGLGILGMVHGQSIGSGVQSINFSIQIDEVMKLIEQHCR